MLKKSRVTKADVYRKWGIPESIVRGGGLKSLIRYTNPPEKGAYWYHFSREVRKRDVEKYGTCISCNRPITFETCQAGHFAPAANCGFDLLFDPMNVNAECAYCNAFDEMHLIGYAKNLDKRYGEGTAALLHAKRQCYKDRAPYPDGTMPRLKDWKANEYAEKLKPYETLL